jgi:hypothetical protein
MYCLFISLSLSLSLFYNDDIGDANSIITRYCDKREKKKRGGDFIE